MRAFLTFRTQQCLPIFNKKTCHFGKKLFVHNHPKTLFFCCFWNCPFPLLSSFLFFFVQHKKKTKTKNAFFFENPFLSPRQPANRIFVILQISPKHYKLGKTRSNFWRNPSFPRVASRVSILQDLFWEWHFRSETVLNALEIGVILRLPMTLANLCQNDAWCDAPSGLNHAGQVRGETGFELLMRPRLAMQTLENASAKFIVLKETASEETIQSHFACLASLAQEEKGKVTQSVEKATWTSKGSKGTSLQNHQNPFQALVWGDLVRVLGVPPAVTLTFRL